MKKKSKIICLAVAVSLAAALFAGCGAKAPETPTTEGKNVAATYKSITSFYEEYEEINWKAMNGDILPIEAECFLGGGSSVELYNAEYIFELWQMMDYVQIPDQTCDGQEWDDGGILFVFTWDDGSEVKFDFMTYEYFCYNGDYYQVRDTDAVGDVCDWARNFFDMERNASEGNDIDEGSDQPAGNDTDEGSDAKEKADGTIEFTEAGFSWDSDGDGQSEYFEIEHYKNGDEAPDVIEIISEGGDSFCIERAYSIEAIKEVDGKLEITYTTGDFYSHDELATIIYEI